jgi:hypothetical protein
VTWVIYSSSLLESVPLKVSGSLTFWILVVAGCEVVMMSPKPKTALMNHSSVSLLAAVAGSSTRPAGLPIGSAGFPVIPAGATGSTGGPPV